MVHISLSIALFLSGIIQFERNLYIGGLIPIIRTAIDLIKLRVGIADGKWRILKHPDHHSVTYDRYCINQKGH